MKRYRAVQKFFVMCLIFSMALAILAGCAKEGEQPSAGTISNFESQTHFHPGTSGDDPASGEFVVFEKKYDYKDMNIMVLHVENQTNRHYNVTIKGKYLGENGETIGEEEQKFEGFSAGWSNYFIFYPRCTFDRFTYEMETEEWAVDPYTGDEDGPYTGYIEFTYSKTLEWKRGVSLGGHSARDLEFVHELVSSHPTAPLHGGIRFLILDNDGRIWYTSHDSLEPYGNYTGIWGIACSPPGAVKGYKNILLKQQPVGKDETIPENVQGVFTAIIAMTCMVHSNLWYEMTPAERIERFGSAN